MYQPIAVDESDASNQAFTVESIRLETQADTESPAIVSNGRNLESLNGNLSGDIPAASFATLSIDAGAENTVDVEISCPPKFVASIVNGGDEQQK